MAQSEAPLSAEVLKRSQKSASVAGRPKLRLISVVETRQIIDLLKAMRSDGSIRYNDVSERMGKSPHWLKHLISRAKQDKALSVLDALAILEFVGTKLAEAGEPIDAIGTPRGWSSGLVSQEQDGALFKSARFARALLVAIHRRYPESERVIRSAGLEQTEEPPGIPSHSTSFADVWRKRNKT